MPKKLKTFVTSMGFFDLAVAAPSMKAALEAWGARRNLFQFGAASETSDAGIVKAAMAKPGIVLRRPVGTSEPYHQDAALPAGFALPSVKDAPLPKIKKAKAKKAPRGKPVEHKTSPAAIISFEKARAERDRARAKEDAAARRDAQKRSSAIEKAQAALDDARKDHNARREKLTRELEDRLESEDTRWAKERAKLEAALDKARKS